MAEADPASRKAYLAALSEWDGTGGIEWGPQARRWLLKSKLGVSQREVGRLLYEYLDAGGKLDQVKETREVWKDRFKFHFDIRLEISGVRVYVETVLVEDSRINPPHVSIVNMKEASA